MATTTLPYKWFAEQKKKIYKICRSEWRVCGIGGNAQAQTMEKYCQKHETQTWICTFMIHTYNIEWISVLRCELNHLYELVPNEDSHWLFDAECEIDIFVEQFYNTILHWRLKVDCCVHKCGCPSTTIIWLVQTKIKFERQLRDNYRGQQKTETIIVIIL